MNTEVITILVAIPLVSSLVTTIVDLIKWVKNAKTELRWERITSLVAGVLFAVFLNIDMFSYFGMPFLVPGTRNYIPFIGSTLTGLLIGYGGTKVFDLFKTITGK